MKPRIPYTAAYICLALLVVSLPWYHHFKDVTANPIVAPPAISTEVNTSFSVYNKTIYIDPNNKNTETAVPVFQKPESVNYKNRIGQTVEAPDGSKIVLQKYSTVDLPNDPQATQWWSSYVGIQSSWDLPSPSKPAVLAIIDTGFALTHEDFTNRFYKNTGESGSTQTQGASKRNCTDLNLPLNSSCNNVDDNVDGVVDNESGVVSYQNPSLLNCTDSGKVLDKSCNRIDDDGNGYIDDLSGWDFVNQDPSSQVGQINPNGTSTKHGSMVMGIAAANSNNGLGVAGIDNYSKLLPLQAIDDDGYGDSLTVGNAIIYAANQGASVINLSLGTNGSDSYILSAIEYAYSKGAVVVAAAGNDGCNCMIYPAKYDVTLSVGALDQTGNKASFSSYGVNLDIMAPGSSITSVSYSPNSPINTYATGSGTSYSAPIVSGTLARIKGAMPSASPAQLVSLITQKTNQNNSGSYYKTVEKGYGDLSITNGISRATTSKNFIQLNSFGNITNGGVFAYTNTADVVYSCESGASATTPVFKSTKSSTFFSINPTDLRLSSNNGFAVSQIFSGCIALPQDTFEKIRVFNTAQEFTNISQKSLLKL